MPLDPRRTLAALWDGPHDPTCRLDAWGGAFALRTPEGPATLLLRWASSGEDGRGDAPVRAVHAAAWGVGAGWAIAAADGFLGLRDDREAFDPADHPVLGPLSRRHAGLRLPRTGLVLRELVPRVLGQLVTWREAATAHRRLVQLCGEDAPGPSGLLLPPSPAFLRALPLSRFMEAGVLGRQARSVKEACAVAERVEEAAAMDPHAAADRLRALPGVGPWTIAHVLLVAHGAADAVPVGDYHLPDLVAFALAGEPRADDARMLALLAPFRPHRGRVPALLHAAGIRAPSYGPRMEARGVF